MFARRDVGFIRYEVFFSFSLIILSAYKVGKLADSTQYALLTQHQNSLEFTQATSSHKVATLC